VKAAEQLVETMTAKWDPRKFRDRYRDDVLKLVERKVREGKTTTPLLEEEPKPKRREADVLDLMPLLKKSLARTRRTASAEPRRARPATARRKKSGT
jgi:DNA end-binding protein Ku